MQKADSTPTVDAYIAQSPPEVQERMRQIRAVIHEEAPDVVEKISYQMPAFILRGKPLVYFAAFAKHIGLYPVGTGVEEFADLLVDYKTSKGTIQFPHDKPLDLDLIRKIVKYRVEKV